MANLCRDFVPVFVQEHEVSISVSNLPCLPPETFRPIMQGFDYRSVEIILCMSSIQGRQDKLPINTSPQCCQKYSTYAPRAVPRRACE